MPIHKLTNGDDYFVGLPPGSDTIYGGNGDDFIDARGRPELGGGGSNITTYGENGDDTLLIGGTWVSFSAAYGGRGNDILSNLGGHYFTLDGGSGDDRLISESRPFGRSNGWGGEGTRMTGGSGYDTFVLNSDTGSIGDLRVNRPGSIEPGVLTDGDAISGLRDVITDYQAGELIDVPGTPVLGPISLQADGYAPTAGLATSADQYGIVQGDYVAGGGFTVDAGGDDLLLVYQHDDDHDLRVDGAVVILDTASSDLLIG